MTSQRLFLAVALCALVCATAAEAQPVVHRFTSSNRPHANAWVLESETGLVLIDTPHMVPETRRLIAVMQATGKPLAGVFITHPHFDHFGGLAELRDAFGDFPIHATAPTAQQMKVIHDKQIAGYRKSFGDDVREEFVAPDRIVEGGDEITVAGITLAVDDLGPGEAHDNVVYYQAELKAVFAGDSSFHRRHFWVAEVRPMSCLRQLAHLQEVYADAAIINPGHGEPHAPAELARQVVYLQFIYAEVTVIATSGAAWDDDAREVVVDAIMVNFPHLETSFNPRWVAGKNADGVARELGLMTGGGGN